MLIIYTDGPNGFFVLHFVGFSVGVAIDAD